MPIQMAVGDSLARWVYNNQPVKFAAIELVPETASDVPETLLGQLNDDGTVTRWHRDPRAGLVALRPEHRHDHRRAGTRHRARRTTAPTVARSTWCTWPGTSWSVSARCCSCCRSGTACPGCSGATCRRAEWFLRIAAAAGVLAVITMEAGWVVTEVGRQPWIVYNLHEGRGRRHRATPACGSRSSVVVVLYVGLASRRSRAARHEPAVPRRGPSVDDGDVPYGPERPHRRRADDDPARCRE